MIIHLIVGLTKKILYKMSQYFPKPYKPSGGDINVKLDLSNYAARTDLRNATGIDTSKLASKSDLVSLKDQVDKIDVDKLENVPDDLSNLKSKVDELDIGKLETTPVDLSKQVIQHKMMLLKGLIIMLRSKMLKIKHLILLTYLLKLLLMLK